MKKNNRFKKVVFLFVLLSLITGCGDKNNKKEDIVNQNNSNTQNNQNNQGGQKKEYTKSEIEANISITEEGFTELGKLVVVVQNNNDVSIDMRVISTFYDDSDKILENDYENFYAIGAKGKIAVEIYDTPESYKNYNIRIDAKQNDEVNYYNELEITHSNEEKVTAQVKSRSNNTIDYAIVSVIYYQGNKIVGYAEERVEDIESGATKSVTFKGPYDKNKYKVTYDNYKVFLSEAYYYDLTK